jgi:hypothetical protein
MTAGLLASLTTFCVLVAGPSGASTGTVGLAYVKFNGTRPTVWAAAANGSHPRKLGHGDSALLSPDGRRVAASLVGSRGSALAIYTAAGRTAGKFFNLKHFGASPLAWSPDSRYLAVALLDNSATMTAGKSALEVIDTSTGKVSASAGGDISGASFAPTGADRVVFGRSQSQLLSAPADLYELAADGSGPITQLTHDGHSINPVWGRRGIALDRTRPRMNGGPVYQIILLSGSHSTQITHTHPALPVDGLQPVAFAADGIHLLAEFVGTDTGQAYGVNVKTHSVKILKVAGQSMVSGFGISRNGKRVLVGYGSFAGPSAKEQIAWIPFSGGPATVLVKGGAGPSWNR